MGRALRILNLKERNGGWETSGRTCAAENTLRRPYDESGFQRATARCGRYRFRRLKSTTLDDKELLDWAEITHPFHPLRGQKFPVLKSQKLEQRDVLSLKGSHRGTIVVPRDWTDKADPNPYCCSDVASPILSFEHLCTLSDLIAEIRPKNRKKRKKVDEWK